MYRGSLFTIVVHRCKCLVSPDLVCHCLPILRSNIYPPQMALLSESRSRIHTKRDSSVLKEAHNLQYDFEPFDISLKCPLLCHIISDENNTATLGDFGQLQLELEECLINSMKRTQVLKNEKKGNKPDIKQFRSFDERLKRFKDSNLQFSQGLPKNKPDLNLQRCEILENVARSLTFSANKNDAENRFWNYILSYELKTSELNPLFEFVESNVPVSGKHKNDGSTGNNMCKQEMKELFEFMIKSHQSIETKKSQHERSGPYTQRLLDSFVKSEDENDEIDEQTFQRLSEKSKRLSYLEANFIEKTLKCDLMRLDFSDVTSFSSPGQESDPEDKLGDVLSLQNRETGRQMQLLVDLAKRDLARQKVRQLLKSTHLEIIEAYKKLIVAKKNKNTISDIERQDFERVIAKKDSLITYMNTCLPYINPEPAESCETNVLNVHLL